MTGGLRGADLLDLADIIDKAFVAGAQGSVVRVLIPVLCEEAARREAEAKELGRTAERIREAEPLPGSASATVQEVVDPNGEREGPGSAAAPCDHVYDVAGTSNACIKCGRDYRDKPAPAADEMAASILALAHRDPCYPTPHPRCVTVAEFIRAQAREIAATNGHLDIAQATCNMQTERADRAEAENARLREALLDARDMVQSWGAYASDYFKDKWDFAGDIAKLNAALARGGEHG